LSFVQEVKKFYAEHVYTKFVRSDQYALLIPGSFGSEVNPKCNMACYDEMISYDALQYYEWADSDPKIVGIAPWIWNNCGEPCKKYKDEIGTRDSRLSNT